MTSLLPASRCIDCGLHKICFPPSFEPAALEQLSNLINAQKVLNKGESLYRQGDSSSVIYAVRSGALKTVSRSLHRLQADGMIDVAGRLITLRDQAGLNEHLQRQCS